MNAGGNAALREVLRRLVRRRARRRRPGARRRRAHAGAGRRAHGRGRRRQGIGRDGARLRGELVRSARRAGGHAARPRRPLRADRDRRGQPSGAGPRRRGGGPPHSRSGTRPRVAGSACLSDFRRRFGAAGAARAGADPGRQAGGHARVARLGRDDRRDKCGAQTSVGDQGRPARSRRVAGARC